MQKKKKKKKKKKFSKKKKKKFEKFRIISNLKIFWGKKQSIEKIQKS